MSGPWDRPSPQSPDDREPSWPAADIESPSHQSPSEPWSAEDPWQERRDSSAWDAWPPADDATYQPDLPTSDPWAESWAEDEAPAAPSDPTGTSEAPPSEAPAFEPRSSEPPASQPPASQPPASEPPAYEPAAYESPAYEPRAYEPPGYEPPVYEPLASDGVAPEPVVDKAPEAVAPPYAPEPEPEPAPEPPELESVPPAPFAAAAETPDAAPESAAPHIEPWSQEADPWGMGSDAWPPVMPTEAATAPPESVTAEPPLAESPAPEPATAEPLVLVTAPEAGAPVASGAEGSAEIPVEGAAVEAEPATAVDSDGEAEPAEPVVAEAEPAIAAAAIVEPPLPVEAERMEEETAAAEGEADEGDAVEPAPDWVAAPGPIFGTAAAGQAIGLAPPAEPVVPAEPELQAESAPIEEPEPSVETTADEPDAGDGLAGAGLAALAAGAMAAPEPGVRAQPAPLEEPERPVETTADEPDGRDGLAGAGLAALAAGTMAAPEPEPAPPVPEPEERHDPPWAAALFGDEPPASVEPEIPSAAAAAPPTAEPIDEVWPPEADLDGLPPVGDHTQVYPSDWAPPPVSSREGQAELEPAAATVRTSLADPEVAGEAPSTAEQAVPWLIGLILLLAGMVIVLLALIFAGDASLGGAAVLPSGSGDPSPSLMAGELVSPSAAASGSPAPSAASTATPDPVPQYGALEMVYQGRAAALAPIYLLHRDFTIDEDPAVLAQDANLDVHRHAWSPDGRVGAGLLADVLVSIEPGKEKRRLGDGISTLTFGDDATTVYAVRVTEDGGNDVASVLAINFTNGDTDELASVSYARPDLTEETALEEAQFLDDGGPIRIFWMDDGTLLLYSTGAGTWTVDPASGAATKLEGHLPQLWSADGHHHITITDKDGTSTLALSNGAGAQLATTTIKGLVSHLRWSPDGERVIFTLGHSASGGGVLQDLYLWDLGDGQAPMQLTSTGAAFGAEWLGTTSRWAAG